MPRTTITTADEIYLVSADDPVPSEGRFRAFVVGQALDSVTKQPLRLAVRVVVDEPGFTVEVKDQNWFVVAGRGRDCVPLLASQSYTIHLELRAERYDPKAVTKTIPQMVAGQYPDLIQLSATETEMHFQP